MLEVLAHRVSFRVWVSLEGLIPFVVPQVFQLVPILQALVVALVAPTELTLELLVQPATAIELEAAPLATPLVSLEVQLVVRAFKQLPTREQESHRLQQL